MGAGSSKEEPCAEEQIYPEDAKEWEEFYTRHKMDFPDGTPMYFMKYYIKERDGENSDKLKRMIGTSHRLPKGGQEVDAPGHGRSHRKDVPGHGKSHGKDVHRSKSHKKRGEAQNGINNGAIITYSKQEEQAEKNIWSGPHTMVSTSGHYSKRPRLNMDGVQQQSGNAGRKVNRNSTYTFKPAYDIDNLNANPIPPPANPYQANTRTDYAQHQPQKINVHYNPTPAPNYQSPMQPPVVQPPVVQPPPPVIEPQPPVVQPPPPVIEPQPPVVQPPPSLVQMFQPQNIEIDTNLPETHHHVVQSHPGEPTLAEIEVHPESNRSPSPTSDPDHYEILSKDDLWSPEFQKTKQNPMFEMTEPMDIVPDAEQDDDDLYPSPNPSIDESSEDVSPIYAKVQKPSAASSNTGIPEPPPLPPANKRGSASIHTSSARSSSYETGEGDVMESDASSSPNEIAEPGKHVYSFQL